MASQAAVPVGPLPCSLWYLRPGLYEDENRRTWVVASLEISTSRPYQNQPDPCITTVTIHLRHVTEFCQELLSFSEASFQRLPIMWQLYPGGVYRGTDSHFWQLMAHDQARSAMGDL
ncbi:T-cell leukemia/lymphoma protein 1B [Nannospalax galili]|uniref:T-cell leukemia/lymphoma protein 1B n=1 Tax=Nannospalax galili TaxID=1026970 RepID=UPI0004ED55CD|nr:T-cell leukemia/lymphoma protein 1B [Nannospalax galili]